MVTTANYSINISGQLFDLSTPRIMGILNVSPDSFFDGGRYTLPDLAWMQAEKMLADGADIIDVGGMSTRPNAVEITVEEERKRVMPVVELLIKKNSGIKISVDTYRSSVAKAAVEAGVCMVNDVSGGELDKSMFETVAKLKVPYVLMHMRGTPQNMQQQTSYKDIFTEMALYFSEKKNTLIKLGVNDVIIDPGFGFAKNLDDNYRLLKNLSYFQMLESPVLCGVSRKSMIYKFLNTEPNDALNGTSVLNTIALMNGASLLRVHDVKEAKEAVLLVEKLRNS